MSNGFGRLCIESQFGSRFTDDVIITKSTTLQEINGKLNIDNYVGSKTKYKI